MRLNGNKYKNNNMYKYSYTHNNTSKIISKSLPLITSNMCFYPVHDYLKMIICYMPY